MEYISIGDVTVSVFAASVVSIPVRVKIKDYAIGVCCFSGYHTAVRVKTGWRGI